MTIYGTAILAFSLLIGTTCGRWLGHQLGVDSDIGGVGIAMLVLILLTSLLQRTHRLNAATQSGIEYWSSIYIPIVVAMAASQNVRGALEGGLVPLLAGGAAVGSSFIVVGLLVKYAGGTCDEVIE